MPTVLSIQSWVACGNVGNNAALFSLQRLGCDTWSLNTVAFSNHTGYGAWRGRAWEPAAIAEVIAGIGERGQFGRCEVVLSGYLGEPALGDAALAAAAAAKAANRGALYCCDPVIGDDHSGIFVRPGIAEFLRDRALPAADIVTPNRFELALLAEREVASLPDALAAAARLRARGPRLVLVTSLAGGSESEIAMLAAGEAGAWRVATPRLPILANGAGDLTAALFLGFFLRRGDVAAALGATAAAVYAVIEATLRAGEQELQIVAAQAELEAPPRQFAPERVG